jgi:uncharacterized protein
MTHPLASLGCGPRARCEHGAYFFSLEAGNPIAVALARTFFHLPYFSALMRSDREDNAVHCQSQRIHRRTAPAGYEACYRASAPQASYQRM